MIYNESLTIEKGLGKIYLSCKEFEIDIESVDLKSMDFREKLKSFLKTHNILERKIDLVLPISELKVFEKKIPKLKLKEKSKLIDNLLESSDYYNETEDNINIINYVYKEYERLIFLIMNKDKIREYEDYFKELEFKVENVDIDFNRIPSCIPNGIGIEKYMYIGYGEDSVGITIYDESEIVFIDNVKLRNKVSEETARIKDATLVANLYMNKFLENKDYELDLIVVRNNLQKSKIQDFFDVKVMSIEELKWI